MGANYRVLAPQVCFGSSSVAQHPAAWREYVKTANVSASRGLRVLLSYAADFAARSLELLDLDLLLRLVCLLLRLALLLHLLDQVARHRLLLLHLRAPLLQPLLRSAVGVGRGGDARGRGVTPPRPLPLSASPLRRLSAALTSSSRCRSASRSARSALSSASLRVLVASTLFSSRSCRGGGGGGSRCSAVGVSDRSSNPSGSSPPADAPGGEGGGQHRTQAALPSPASLPASLPRLPPPPPSPAP